MYLHFIKTTSGLQVDLPLIYLFCSPWEFQLFFKMVASFFRMIDFTKDLSANDPERKVWILSSPPSAFVIYSCVPPWKIGSWPWALVSMCASSRYFWRSRILKVKIFLIIGRDDGQVFCALNLFAFHQNYKWTTSALTIDISLLLALRIPTFFQDGGQLF